jgi:hypothetical protein
LSGGITRSDRAARVCVFDHSRDVPVKHAPCHDVYDRPAEALHGVARSNRRAHSQAVSWQVRVIGSHPPLAHSAVFRQGLPSGCGTTQTWVEKGHTAPDAQVTSSPQRCPTLAVAGVTQAPRTQARFRDVSQNASVEGLEKLREQVAPTVVRTGTGAQTQGPNAAPTQRCPSTHSSNSPAHAAPAAMGAAQVVV